ncbi:MAG: cbb3-type cytochrome c oxidase subunit 3 [Hyphomicrobium sp.]
MTYETAVLFGQIVAMVLFGSLMIGIIIYVARPSNRARFDRAAAIPLAVDDVRILSGGNHGGQ